MGKFLVKLINILKDELAYDYQHSELLDKLEELETEVIEGYQLDRLEDEPPIEENKT